MKRIFIAILFGLIAGGLCAAGAFSAHMLKYSVITLIFILLNRAVMGFAIAISSLRVHWVWNGVVVGIAVGSIFSYYLFMNMGPGPMPLVNLFVNGVFGLMIEFFTTVVFKQPRAMLARTAASLPG